MEENCCFICSENSEKNSDLQYFFLINLATKRYKTNFLTLVSDLIDKEYEMRISDKNKICERCCVLLEKFDELQQETKLVKSVLSRQIAHTYNIVSHEELVFMDNSKVFVKLNPSANQISDIKYSCKMCKFMTSHNVDIINAHCLFHKTQTDSKIQANEIIKDLSSVTKRNNPIGREIKNRRELVNAVQMNEHSTPEEKDKTYFDIEVEIDNHQYDEDTLENVIDLNLLEDDLYDSNLKNYKCMMNPCEEKFKYVADYVRHLKQKHKSCTPNHIFAVVRANIKRPNKHFKLMCPFCFTRAPNTELLEDHVKKHEEVKSQLFTDRINDFITNLIKLSSFYDNSEIFKNGSPNNEKTNCNYCKIKGKSTFFPQAKLYHNHLAIEHRRCFICLLLIEDKMLLKEHIISHTSHEYPCIFPSICNDVYQTRSDRNKHLKESHSDLCFFCNFCSDWFDTKNDFKKHERICHADKKNEVQNHQSVCDHCGASFKDQELLLNHQKTEHLKRKIYTCSACRQNTKKFTCEFRYILMDHIANYHKRTIVDNETNFYKCYVCSLGFSSQNRETFLEHLVECRRSFCPDCNSDCTSSHHLEAHRERCHQDFSLLVDKQCLKPTKNTPKAVSKTETNNSVIHYEKTLQTDLNHPSLELLNVDEEPQHQIVVQTEDGSLLNILTENGEFLIQNFEELLPNEDSQIQFLIEQSLSTNADISYGQPDMEVVIQNENSQGNQENLMETYENIFEQPEDNVSPELIASHEIANDGVIITSLEQDANQSTLDELQDVLLSVAAAAEKEKKPKVIEQKVMRESLWGKKRTAEQIGSTKKKHANVTNFQEIEPASNFSQAYEFFVKGFDAKKQKNL